MEWYVPAIIAYQAIHHNPKKIIKQTFSTTKSISTDSKKPISSKWIEKNAVNSEIGFWLNRSKDISNNLFDITKVTWKDIPSNIDIFTYSFPCQDISNQGKQKGFDIGSNSRSGLLWEIDRILSNLQKNKKKSLPKYLLLENVKAMVNKNHTKNYHLWLKRLDQLGYNSKQYILNAANFGSSQNRERAFVLSVLKSHQKKVNFEFQNLENKFIKNKKAIKSIINKNNNNFNDTFNKYKLKKPRITKNNIKKYEMINYTNFSSENFLFDINYSGPTLTASGALNRIKLYFDKNKIREMTPAECFEYMGFTKTDFNLVNKTKLTSPNKQKFLCGNSISVEVLEAIFESLVF